MLLIAAGALWLCAKPVFSEDAAAMAATAVSLHPFSSASGAAPPAPWRVVGLPRADKPLTRFELAPLDGRPVLRVQTDHSYANLVHDLPDLQGLLVGGDSDNTGGQSLGYVGDVTLSP